MKSLLVAPAALLFIASWHQPALFLGFLAVAGLMALGALLVALIAARAKVAELSEEIERRDREAEVVHVPLVRFGRTVATVTPTGDGGMDQLLLEVLTTPSIPDQRRPGGAS